MTASPSAVWSAPYSGRPVCATASPPGSKSITNRALILAALSDGPSLVRRPLRARDTELMAQALRGLGVEVVDSGDDWQVTPGSMRGPANIDCGLAGTVMRFVPPVACLADGPVRFDGDPRARERPMSQIISALRDLGATVEDEGAATLPFTVQGTGSLRGGRVTLDASSSSQFVSALLLTGARFDGGVEVRHVGPSVPSRPHIDMTVRMLRERGVAVETDTSGEAERWMVGAGAVRALDVEVEPDLSNAAPFLAAALATGGEVVVPRWPADTDQAGDHLRRLLASMGARVERDGDALVVRGPRRVDGVDVDLHDVGELTPVVAALCALAGSPSRLRGIAHLRGHETDRLKAIAAEINALGGDVRETDDGLEIRPRRMRGGLFHTYADHRMAHAGAVLGLVVPGVEVEDIATTSKTYPGFAADWESLLT